MIDDKHAQKLFGKLLEIMDRLRSPSGCPWDREQDRISLKPYILEEAHEVVEAIEDGIPAKIKEELGDLLFQVVFQAKIGKEHNEFSAGDILEELRRKMIRRHPHVFGDTTVKNSREVIHNWETIKKEESRNTGKKPLLAGVPRRLPALLRAQRLQEKAATLGFDWDDPRDIIEKIREELAELMQALEQDNQTLIQEELGDLMFSVINLGRFLNIQTDEALRQTINKFISRFESMEQSLVKDGRIFSELSLQEMESLWQQSKKKETN